MSGLREERSLWARRRMLWLAMALILSGGLLAHFIQTSGGIRILDVRFAGTGAVELSALLYVPPNATRRTPAPGILAIHGYFNSREAQDGFAIEFARRGYVVLALDQRGHGYSAPGSSTGAPFAPAGTPTFPRNLAVVFSRFDEFSGVMWDAPTAREVTHSPKTRSGIGRRLEPVSPSSGWCCSCWECLTCCSTSPISLLCAQASVALMQVSIAIRAGGSPSQAGRCCLR
jgi:hypothetical protein